MSNEISKFIEELDRMQENYRKSKIELVKKNGPIAIRNAQRELSKICAEDFKNKYYELANEFYDEYTPDRYERKNSLVKDDIYETVFSDDDTIFHPIVHDERMTTFRDGSTSVYDLTLGRGYHGGAMTSEENIKERDTGISPGEMRYREPHPYYTRWGKVAFHSESFNSKWHKWIQEYTIFANEKYSELLRREVKKLIY